MMRPFEPKDPDGRMPYWFDATDFAEDEGSTVASMTIAVTENDDGELTIEDEAQSGAIRSFWPTGGTLGVTYVITCHCTLENGAEEDCSRELLIRQK
jgi:hypothetical protein